MTDMTVANPRGMAYAGSLVRRKGCDSSEEWHTPAWVIAAVKTSIGGIDLDPFSSTHADRTVGANRYFDRRDDAFKQSWEAISVFMNPPYGPGVCGRAVVKFAAEWRLGMFDRGIMLLNACTDTAWYHDIARDYHSVCHLRGRLKFETPDDKHVQSNPRPQMLILYCRPGTRWARQFRKEMTSRGHHVLENGMS